MSNIRKCHQILVRRSERITKMMGRRAVMCFSSFFISGQSTIVSAAQAASLSIVRGTGQIIFLTLVFFLLVTTTHVSAQQPVCDFSKVVGECAGGVEIISRKFVEGDIITKGADELHWKVWVTSTSPQCSIVSFSYNSLLEGYMMSDGSHDVKLEGNEKTIEHFQRTRNPNVEISVSGLYICREYALLSQEKEQTSAKDKLNGLKEALIKSDEIFKKEVEKFSQSVENMDHPESDEKKKRFEEIEAEIQSNWRKSAERKRFLEQEKKNPGSTGGDAKAFGEFAKAFLGAAAKGYLASKGINTDNLNFAGNSSGNSVDQNCESLPPKCAAASNQGTNFINTIGSGTVRGITGQASILYCASLATITVNDICAAEFDSQGRSSCASTSRKQSSVNRNGLSALQNHPTFSLSGTTESNCSSVRVR